MKLAVIGSGPLARQVAELAGTFPENDVTALPAEAFPLGQVDRERMDVAERLTGADWVFDVSGLPLDGKRDLLSALCRAASPGTVISTDESIVPMRELRDGLEANGCLFAVTHIFAPPAQMRLAEIAAEPADFDRVARLCETCLYRKVVAVPDQPGFIANRLGFFWLALVMDAAQRAGLSPPEADAAAAAVTGSPVGAFALADLIGLDVVLALDGQLRARLPDDDPMHDWKIETLPLLGHLVAAGALGRAAGAGFYRRSAGVREAIDADALTYRPVSAGHADPRSDFAMMISGRLDRYAKHLSATTGTPMASIAEIMSLGYGWTRGATWSATPQR